jgi:alkylated DNA repair dioxygenase AlkB
MAAATKKRTLDAFFASTSKKARVVEQPTQGDNFSRHSTYPFLIPFLPASIQSELSSWPSSVGKVINDQPDLDLIYFQPYVPKSVEREVFEFLRSQLPFYRVEYKIKRGPTETQIRTPRYTTVFGLDETSRFDEEGNVVDAETRTKIQRDPKYLKYPPRPIPKCLDDLRRNTEAATGCKFNFCLVNYYASGADSISYHSDDERFLGPLPAIASFSLGSKRDFLLKHKPVENVEFKPPTKLPLASGDMILMRGKTQSNWLHSIPKRSGKNLDDGGRINITFRRALVKGGTENYYNYNVGTGPVYRWDASSREMKLWNPPAT